MDSGESGTSSIGSGRYTLKELHAEADGVRFWYAYDERVRRDVAITAIPADVTAPYAVKSRTSLVKRVESPAIARILDVFDDAGTSYVVAERRPAAPAFESRTAREVAQSVLPLAKGTELAHRTGVTLSLDDPDRTQLDDRGAAFVAFPAPAVHHEPERDVRGLGAVLAGQLAVVPAADPDRAQLESLADRALAGSVATADTMAQVLDHVASGAPAPSKPMIAPPPATQRGLLDRVTDPANRKVVIGVAAALVLLLFAWAVAAYIADDSNFPVKTEDSIITTTAAPVSTSAARTTPSATAPTPSTSAGVPNVPPPATTQPQPTPAPPVTTPPVNTPPATTPPTQNLPPGVLPCYDGYTHQPPPDGPCMPIGGQPAPAVPTPTPAPAPTRPEVLPCYPGYSHQPPPNGPCLPSR